MTTPDFETLFRLSLLISAALLGLVSVLTLGLLASKLLRQVWTRHRLRRKDFYAPLLLQVLLKKSDSLQPAPLRKKFRFADAAIVEHDLLRWEEKLSGNGLRRLKQLFEKLGFSDDETRRLKSWRWWIRARAAQRLGQMECKKAQPHLLEALRDRVLEVRLMAAWALGKLGDPQAIGEIVPALAHSSKLAALRVTNTIAALGPAGIPILEDLLSNPDPEVQILAIQLLGSMKVTEAVEPILQRLESRNLELRIAAARALGAIAEEQSCALLENSLEDPEWPMRAVAAAVLGQLKRQEAIPKLKGTLGDRSWWVRLNSGEALAKMGRAGKRALEESLHAPDRFARDMAAQWLEEFEQGAAVGAVP
ncbi:MAG: HEAT repeat domain-containing protein [Elusimicrobia bacterium]|nr:HEAT repeat domain-containing protein [Elusimicrobiota bacterium]